MERLFYSTGQVARQLGTTLAAIRALCGNGVIAAETSPGGQWRVPASEVERLKRDGLPPIPRPLHIETALPATNGPAARHAYSNSLPEPSVEVVSAEDLVAITRSTLEKRRIDREIEENEDWFREHHRQQAAAAAVERQRTEAEHTEHRRRLWMQQWAQYALNSVPSAARREVTIEVHAAVSAALSALPTCEPVAIARRLVDAAVHRALRPWRRKQEIESALKSAMNRLPWDVRTRSEWAPLKQCAWDAAVEAVGKLREEASYREMEAVAEQAVQPVIRACEHAQACQRIVGSVYIFDARGEEQEAAKQAVRKALAALPIGATPNEFEKTKETALTPYKAAVARRKETARLEIEKQAQRRTAEWKVERQLDHIARYLEQEYEFDGGYAEMRRETQRLRPLIREALIDALVKTPSMSDNEIRASIESQVDDGI